MKESIPIN